MTYDAIIQEQIELLRRLSVTLLAGVRQGQAEAYPRLFAVQDRLEHWLQYLAPTSLEPLGYGPEAPPPLDTRPAPPLAFADETLDGTPDPARWQPPEGVPRVSFPPEPLWVEDLETPQEDERERERG